MKINNIIINEHVYLLSVQKVQLHWSSVIGASHTNDYTVWNYGEYASRGVKEVCEYGFSNFLETEFKRNVSQIQGQFKA